MNSSDEELISLFKKGDVSALGQLYDRHYVKLYNFLLGMVRSRDDAVDLLQESFCVVVRKLSGFNPGGSFKAYLFRIAYNRAVDFFRRRSKGGNRQLGDTGENLEALLIEFPSSAPQPQDQVIKGETLEKLRKALFQLPIEQRQVILLKHYSDLTFREIAQILDIPLNTAIARLHYGLKNLKKEMEESVI